MMAALQFSWGRLPEDRVELYAEMVRLLLVRWQEARLGQETLFNIGLPKWRQVTKERKLAGPSFPESPFESAPLGTVRSVTDRLTVSVGEDAVRPASGRARADCRTGTASRAAARLPGGDAART